MNELKVGINTRRSFDLLIFVFIILSQIRDSNLQMQKQMKFILFYLQLKLCQRNTGSSVTVLNSEIESIYTKFHLCTRPEIENFHD